MKHFKTCSKSCCKTLLCTAAFLASFPSLAQPTIKGPVDRSETPLTGAGLAVFSTNAGTNESGVTNTIVTENKAVETAFREIRGRV
jgi:hypothetical protein